jgi:hypothetical protein
MKSEILLHDMSSDLMYACLYHGVMHLAHHVMVVFVLVLASSSPSVPVNLLLEKQT